MAGRPAIPLRLRLTLLYGGLLAVVAATLLGVAVVVLDRAVRQLPRFNRGALRANAHRQAVGLGSLG